MYDSLYTLGIDGDNSTGFVFGFVIGFVILISFLLIP